MLNLHLTRQPSPSFLTREVWAIQYKLTRYSKSMTPIGKHFFSSNNNSFRSRPLKALEMLFEVCCGEFPLIGYLRTTDAIQNCVFGFFVILITFDEKIDSEPVSTETVDCSQCISIYKRSSSGEILQDTASSTLAEHTYLRVRT